MLANMYFEAPLADEKLTASIKLRDQLSLDVTPDEKKSKKMSAETPPKDPT